MQNPRIIFQNDEGGVSIIVPSPEALAVYGIQAIAQKDVPFGKTYAFIDASEIPEDRTFRAAWEVDAADLTHGVGSISDQFPSGE